MSFAITYAGAAFAPKNESYRALWLLACFDLQITVNNVKCIQLLTFVLMKTFDLDIINNCEY